MFISLILEPQPTQARHLQSRIIDALKAMLRIKTSTGYTDRAISSYPCRQSVNQVSKTTVTLRLLISTLITIFLVMGSVAHASTHEVLPEAGHELVECHGCSVVSATIEAPDTHFYLRVTSIVRETPPSLGLATSFDHYSSRAPPSN